MKIPDNGYRGDLQYEKLENYDPDVSLEYAIEQVIREELQEHGTRKVIVIGESWEKDDDAWCIPAARNKDIDRLLQWLHEIEVRKISEVKIKSPDPRYMS